MGAVGRGEVVGVNLLLQHRLWEIDKETWARGASNAPEYIGRLGIVPGCGFANYSGRFSGGGEVGGDELEPLRRAYCSCLRQCQISSCRKE